MTVFRDNLIIKTVLPTPAYRKTTKICTFKIYLMPKLKEADFFSLHTLLRILVLKYSVFIPFTIFFDTVYQIVHNKQITDKISFFKKIRFFKQYFRRLVGERCHCPLIYSPRLWTMAKHIVSKEMLLSKLHIFKRYPFIHKWIIPIFMLFGIRSFTGRICVVIVLCIVILIHL